MHRYCIFVCVDQQEQQWAVVEEGEIQVEEKKKWARLLALWLFLMISSGYDWS